MRSSYLLTPSNSLFLVVGIGMIDNVPVDLRIKVPSGEYPEITNAWAGLDFDQDTKNDFSPYIANAKISQEIARATAKKTTNLLESQIKLIWKSLPPCKATTKSEQPEPLCGSLSGSHKARARLAPL